LGGHEKSKQGGKRKKVIAEKKKNDSTEGGVVPGDQKGDLKATEGGVNIKKKRGTLTGNRKDPEKRSRTITKNDDIKVGMFGSRSFIVQKKKTRK